MRWLPRIARQATAQNADVAVRDASVLEFARVQAPVVFGIDRAAIGGDLRVLAIGWHWWTCKGSRPSRVCSLHRERQNKHREHCHHEDEPMHGRLLSKQGPDSKIGAAGAHWQNCCSTLTHPWPPRGLFATFLAKSLVFVAV